jgi:cytochrome P450
VAGLVYTLWEMARPENRAYHDQLVTEMRPFWRTRPGQLVPYAAINASKWLECCIYEGLRLHTPSGHIQARVVPKGGATIAGYLIPEEVSLISRIFSHLIILNIHQIEVGVSLFSIHLNANIFKDPYSFRPERWLEGTTNPDILQQMRLAWMPFGHGARICVGKE